MKRLFKFGISLGVFAWDAAAGGFGRWIGRAARPRGVVLYYHAIRDGQRQRFAQQMDQLLRCSEPLRADHAGVLNPGKRYTAITFDDGFISVLKNALPELESRGIPATLFVPSGSLGRNPIWIKNADAPARNEVVLSAEELKRLRGHPVMAIGSHSVSHPNLAKLDPAQARVELADSKSALETLLGGNVSLFSFPHGAYNERLVQEARAAGYKRVFTVSPSPAFARPDEFVTGRTLADPADWPLEFKLKLLGAYRWLPAISRLKARLRRFLKSPSVSQT